MSRSVKTPVNFPASTTRREGRRESRILPIASASEVPPSRISGGWVTTSASVSLASADSSSEGPGDSSASSRSASSSSTGITVYLHGQISTQPYCPILIMAKRGAVLVRRLDDRHVAKRITNELTRGPAAPPASKPDPLFALRSKPKKFKLSLKAVRREAENSVTKRYPAAVHALR